MLTENNLVITYPLIQEELVSQCPEESDSVKLLHTSYGDISFHEHPYCFNSIDF